MLYYYCCRKNAEIITGALDPVEYLLPGPWYNNKPVCAGIQYPAPVLLLWQKKKHGKTGTFLIDLQYATYIYYILYMYMYIYIIFTT